MTTKACQVVPLQELPALGGDGLPSDEWCRTTAPLQAEGNEFALSLEGSGHHDLLLQAILPGRLASRLYPRIVSRTAGAIAILSLAIGTVVPVLALYVRSVPIQWTWACLFAAVSGLRRAALLDLRVLKLLLRQFETWYADPSWPITGEVASKDQVPWLIVMFVSMQVPSRQSSGGILVLLIRVIRSVCAAPVPCPVAIRDQYHLFGCHTDAPEGKSGCHSQHFSQHLTFRRCMVGHGKPSP
jgi:hypothetical protein